MKVTVKEDRGILIEEVFNGIEFKSADGESLTIVMRDSGFEVIYEGHYYHLQKGQLYSRGLIHAEIDERPISNINYVTAEDLVITNNGLRGACVQQGMISLNKKMSNLCTDAQCGFCNVVRKVKSKL